MSSDVNIHQGHRSRLIEKVNTNAPLLAEHELLEALLFYAIPRRDTNPLAHKLIKNFGGINQVFNAKFHELLSVEGVGEKTASLIIAVGTLYKKLRDNDDKKVVYNSFEKIKTVIYKQFTELDKEQFLFVMLDKDYKKIKQYFSEGSSANIVNIDLSRVAFEISTCKPAFVIIAHNHVSASCAPSLEDDQSTDKIDALCAMHGVKLLEHLIFNRHGQAYSYRQNCRIKSLV